MSHHCHAMGCNKAVEPKLLMCAPHWRKVPRDMQNLIWDAYVPGQEIRKNPTSWWFEVADMAIKHVGWLEGKVTNAEYMDRCIKDVSVTARYKTAELIDMITWLGGYSEIQPGRKFTHIWSDVPQKVMEFENEREYRDFAIKHLDHAAKIMKDQGRDFLREFGIEKQNEVLDLTSGLG